jgi:hypothetical protein
MLHDQQRILGTEVTAMRKVEEIEEQKVRAKSFEALRFARVLVSLSRTAS